MTFLYSFLSLPSASPCSAPCAANVIDFVSCRRPPVNHMIESRTSSLASQPTKSLAVMQSGYELARWQEALGLAYL